jgi:KDO2-lipid IV(A) lauroyltransferase
MRVINWINYVLYSALWKLVRYLPEGIAYKVFESLAGISYRRNGKRVQRLRSNYRHVAPDVSAVELEEMVKDGLRSAMRYWCDTFRISDWSTEKTLQSTATNNENFLFEPIEKKRGVIVAVPHAGNWDHAGAYFCAKGARVNTVAEHLKPERLFRKFLAHRERMGMNVLDLDAGVLSELEMILKDRGELVALVSDRDLSKSGIDVHFFGATARMPAGPARLAYDTGADLITAFVAYRREGIEVFFTPPIAVDRAAEKSREIARVTQVIAARFEDAIRKNPTSWHMQQRIFIDEDFVERP